MAKNDKQNTPEEHPSSDAPDPIARPAGATVAGDSIAVDDGADAASAITYSENPDKPDPSTVAQVEDPHDDGAFEGELAPAGKSNLDVTPNDA